jgi:hypothetical protein
MIFCFKSSELLKFSEDLLSFCSVHSTTLEESCFELLSLLEDSSKLHFNQSGI